MMKSVTLKWMMLALVSWMLPMQITAADGDSLQLLWIGNSFSFTNDIPGIVKDIAASQQVKLSVTRFLKPGERFSGHLKNKELVNALKRGGWDYVILQGFSSTPAYSTESVIHDIYPYAHTLDSLAKVHSPNVHIIYYMTWGHKYGNVRQTDYPLDDTYELMQERIKTTYLEMTHANNGWCAPVGMAWWRTRTEHPEYQLYVANCFHPSLLGSYLSANVIFTTIYQRRYQTNVTRDIPIDQAENLQQIAQETVLGNLKLWNVGQ